MPTPRLRDERLAWLAVRDQLERRSRRGVFGILMRFLGARRRLSAARFAGLSTAWVAEEQRKEHLSARMMRYSIVVDRLARQLSAEDRQMLRDTGAVPEWFLPRVLAEAPKVRLR